ncbi:hypothetical protein B0A69_07380 [Chryseobacterium shigense]|uniref:Uncharacterized protein n=1 Tax=Chryseobacterium shigense TaxID=297244 RepID=A0A1N7I6A7_9FLAO|nr:DUF6169 family protein [Chryseobacterium shigense]PQA95255.1 hypothetical protein B0A69_07380 [Chryseobacterium shigense]SIS32520.1 hypothetical protein SAMN05421639_102248 [Chryseobacterium shigense]
MYDWIEKGNYVFEFFTDNHDVYYLYLKPKEDHFADFCSECKDIYEVDLKCVSGKPSPDERVKETVIAILKQVLTERCQSLVFFCDNEGGKAECREILFNRWYEAEDEADEKVQRFVRSHCEDFEGSDCFNMYFIADKDCYNFKDNVDDFFSCDHIEQED